jgi:protein-S-isoprenylcysteine O-methyltransferase Ste14
LKYLPTLVFAVVMLSWVAFVIVFLTNKNPPSGPDSKRDRTSIIGLALQGISYLFVWSIHRPFLTPMTNGSKPLEIALNIVAVALAFGSVWFVMASVRTLGKQWSLAARVLQGHKLVTQGPYSIVRNPIYTGMFGMLLATGLAISHWIGLLAAVVVYTVGTAIRVRSEERLLREAFGPEFDAYERKVPALIPFLF